MKYFFYLTLTLFAGLQATAQDYPFKKNFYPGFIILKNESRVHGNIRWMPDQATKLRFTKNINGNAQDKYAPEDLLGFQVDSFRFVSLFDFSVYAEKYEWLGGSTKIKSDFGELIDSGKCSIYLVTTSGYNQNNDLQYYRNYLFQRKTGVVFEYAAYPLGRTVSAKGFESMKAALVKFFSDYPEIVSKINALGPQDGFSATLELIKKLNA